MYKTSFQTRRILIGFVAIAVCGTTLCVSAGASTVWADPCLPSFPYSGGWLGGDGASSISLSAERELWLFGDSFVSYRSTKTRAGVGMVANTIAISSCRGGKWTIQSYWRVPAHRRHAHQKRAFFDSGTRAFRYWPLDGFLQGNTLYVALLRVVNTRAREPFAFEIVGVDLAKIANPDAEPGDWTISYVALSRSRVALPGVSIIIRPPYAWLFGTMDHPHDKRQAVILTRINLDRLDHPAESLEYLVAGEKWRAAPIRDDALELVARGQTDFSVRYHRKMAKWVMVQQQSGFGTGEIGMRTSERIDGPWSPYRSLVSIGEMHTRRTRHKRIFCYAAKEHTSFESVPGTLVVTYTCNSLKFRNLVADMSIYRPIVTQLQIPADVR